MQPLRSDRIKGKLSPQSLSPIIYPVAAALGDVRLHLFEQTCLQQEHRELAVERAERMTVFGSSFSCLVGFFRLVSPLGTLNRSSGQSLNPRSFAVEKKQS